MMQEEEGKENLLDHEHGMIPVVIEEPITLKQEKTFGKKAEIAFKYIFGSGGITYITMDILVRLYPELEPYRADLLLLLFMVANVALLFLYDIE